MERMLQIRGLGYAAAALAIGGVTAVCALLRAHVNEMTVALAMLLAVLLVAAVWRSGPAVAASVWGMLCLNYFFLPPTYTFTIADPRNWTALTTFFITALTAGRLSAWARQRAAEAEASRKQARLASAYNRSLLEASLDPLVTIGSDGKINDVNAAAEAVSGRSRLELIGTDFAEYFTEREKARAAFERTYRDGFVRGYALELRRRDGHSTSVLYDGSLYRDADGNVIGVVAAARPIGTYAGKPLSTPPDPRVVRHLKGFVWFTTLLSGAVGMLGLIGWTFHISPLKSLVPGAPVMEPNTAVCFVLIGLSLCLARQQDSHPRRGAGQHIGQITAFIVALVGLLSLLEYLAGWDLGIDQWLFTATPADVMGNVRPGLMAPITALDLVLLGFAVLFLDTSISWRSRRYWPAQFLALLAGVAAFFGFLDYLLGPRAFYTHIALQTAVMLCLFPLGLLCARTERGLAAVLASSTAGGALVRRFLPAAILIPLLIGVSGWSAFSAGLFAAWSEFSLMTVGMIILFAGFTIWNGYRVDRSDAERQKSERILQRREEELREAQRLAQVGSWWWEPKSENVTWSEQLSRIAGRDPRLPPPSYQDHRSFYTSESSARFDAAVEAAIRTGGPYELDLEMVRADGTIRSVTDRGEVERDANGQVVLVRGTVQDVTERRRAESQIRQLARLQAVVAELGQQALRREPSGKVLDGAVARVAQALDVEYCKVLELMPGAKTLLLRSGVGWKEGYVGHASVGSDRDSQAGYTLLSNQPVLVEDLRSETRFSGPALLHEHGVVSGMSVIIPTSEGPYGVLGAHTRRRRAFSADEVNFMQAVANVLGAMIERRRAEETLRESEANLNRAQEIAHIGSWYLNLTENRLTWSDEVFRIFGVAPGTALTYEAFLDFVHPEDRQSVHEAWAAALKGAPYDIEHRIVVNRNLKWVRERARVGFDQGGNAVEGLGTVQDITERKRAEEALQKSADEIHDLYNHAPCGYHSVDKDGVFVRVNDTELQWLGYAREEIIGKMKFSDLLTAESSRTFQENFPRLKAQGAIRDVEFDMVRKDGTVLPVLLGATAITDRAGNYLMSRSTVYDITARKRAETEVRMLAHLQSVVAELGERALRGAPLAQMLDDAATQVAQALGVDYCKILELLATHDALLLKAGVGWKPGYVGHATVGLGSESQAGYTLLAGGPVAVEDLTAETRFSGTALLREHEVASGVTVLISTSEGPYGVLGAHSRRRRTFTADEVNFLQAAANVLGSVIERNRAEAQLWRVNQAQRVLSKCNEALIRATEEASLLQQICDLVVEEAGYRLCWVGRAESDEAKSVRVIAQAGFEAGYLATLNITWADTERGRGPTGACIRAGETVTTKHIATDPRMIPWRAEALKRGYASCVAIPLIVEGRVFGAITIYAAEPDAFGSEEVALLSELASDLAFGIGALRTRAERAKGEEALREKEERIRLILDSAAEAICGLDPEGNCTWVNQAGARMLGYADANALLGENFHDLTHSRLADGRPLPRDQCRAYQALVQGDYVRVDDEVMWRADGTFFPAEYWSHPMRHNGDVIGAVVTFLDITERKRAESEIRILNAELEQRVIVRTAELQAANKLKDELIVRERTANTELERAREREVEVGYRIQQNLLLDQPPEDIPGLRIAALTIPSQRIDGDFYIFLKHQNQSLDVVVGDVMGKGVPAALLGAATKSHFLKALSNLMALSKSGKLPEPKDIVMLAHADVVRQLIDLESFVTLSYARFDVNRHTLDLVDCGHTGTVHWHARTGSCDVVHGDNLPLGVREGEIYDQISVPFEPGDLVLFYSDGITEARNPAGEVFGSDRLTEQVRLNAQLEPAALVDAIRRAVLVFSESARFSDDLTSVAIRVEEKQIPMARAELQILSDLAQLRQAREFVRAFCRGLPDLLLDEERAGALELAVNEAASNIMKHAYHGRSDQWIHLEGEAFPDRVVIRLLHVGDPFDPAAAPPPALEGARESGLGAYIISRSVDQVRYYRDERGRNCVALTKSRKP